MPSLTLADAATRTAPMAKKGWIKKSLKPESKGSFRAKDKPTSESATDKRAKLYDRKKD